MGGNTSRSGSGREPADRARCQASQTDSAPQNLVALSKLAYEEVVKAIIRPPRAAYSVLDLGPLEFGFRGSTFSREDFGVTSTRRGVLTPTLLQCSMWRPIARDAPSTAMACVIYLHGNSGSRIASMEIMQTVLNEGACLVAFDFAGSGKSDGDFVTLGHLEQLDLACVIAALRARDNLSTLALWGRSMGAVTALLAASSDPSIAALVLDSPFSDLKQLCLELVDAGRASGEGPLAALPKWAVGMGAAGILRMVRQTILQRTEPGAQAEQASSSRPSPSLLTSMAAMTRLGRRQSTGSAAPSLGALGGLDIFTLRPLDVCPSTFVPALFVAGLEDSFVRPQHTRDLQAAYAGESSLTLLPGHDHNSLRPPHFLESAGCFLRARLGVPEESALWARASHTLAASIDRGGREQARAARRAARGAAAPAMTGQGKEDAVGVGDGGQGEMYLWTTTHRSGEGEEGGEEEEELVEAGTGLGVPKEAGQEEGEAPAVPPWLARGVGVHHVRRADGVARGGRGSLTPSKQDEEAQEEALLQQAILASLAPGQENVG